MEFGQLGGTTLLELALPDKSYQIANPTIFTQASNLYAVDY